jgi:dipeptidyl aminopeptidase/acylaminoacyl peptidase
MLIVPCVLVLSLLWWGWYSAGLVMSLPREPVEILPSAFGLVYEDVEFASFDGVVLKGWFVSSPRPSDVTLLMCHGRGASRSDILPETQSLASRGGYNLFYFDFRNHGLSGGNKNTLGRWESEDVLSALRWVKENRPTRARRMGLYGMSMGGAAAIVAAAGEPAFEAVAAESAFTSAKASIVRYAGLFHHVLAWMVPYTFLWVRLRLGFDVEEFSPERYVARISPRPLFLLQGSADVRMPPSEGERLFALAGEPKALWTVPGADHAELWETAGREYEDKLQAFFDKTFR